MAVASMTVAGRRMHPFYPLPSPTLIAIRRLLSDLGLLPPPLGRCPICLLCL